MDKMEHRFALYMILAVWVHITRDIVWFSLGVPVAAIVASYYSVRREQSQPQQ